MQQNGITLSIITTDHQEANDSIEGLGSSQNGGLEVQSFKLPCSINYWRCMFLFIHSNFQIKLKKQFQPSDFKENSNL